MRRVLITMCFLWAMLSASPLHAQGCYPPPCGTSPQQSPAAGTPAPPVVDFTATRAAREDVRSSSPVVLAGLLIVTAVFGTIVFRRRLEVVRRPNPAPARAVPTAAVARREVERLFR